MVQRKFNSWLAARGSNRKGERAGRKDGGRNRGETEGGQREGVWRAEGGRARAEGV